MGCEEVFTPAPTPESLGIPSRAILSFLNRIDSERICMHGFLLVRHNQIAAEGYWAPWSAERKHRMYSVSKSFVSLAVGMMIDEGKLTLDGSDRRTFSGQTAGRTASLADCLNRSRSPDDVHRPFAHLLHT